MADLNLQSCHIQPKKMTAPSGAPPSDCSSVCHHSSCCCCNVGDDDAWVLWPWRRLSEHLQTHVSLDVQMDLGYSLWRTRPHVPNTFPWAQWRSQRRQRRTSLCRSWCREEGAGGGGGGGRGWIKGNTVYIWFWLLLLSTDRCLSVYDAMKTAFQVSDSCSQGRV